MLFPARGTLVNQRMINEGKIGVIISTLFSAGGGGVTRGIFNDGLPFNLNGISP